jgi:predicted transglutaminase-like cysteine proteinase
MMIASLTSKLLSAKLRTVLIAAVAAPVIYALPAFAEPTRLAHVLVAEVAEPPPGWREFCAREPGECAGPAIAPRHFAPSRKAWGSLVLINKWVNDVIKPLTDLEHWGVAERWSYPDDGYGDCEDYVLLKRRMLISSGWPREALLVTLVRDQKNEGHAVLTVTTDRGDYVLDNQNNNILLWSKTGYRFFKRQSKSNAAQWVSLNDSRPSIATKTPSSGSPSDLLAANSVLTTIPRRARK